MTVKRGEIRQRVVDMAQVAINAYINDVTKDCKHAVNYRPKTMHVAQLPFIFTQRGRSRYVEHTYGVYSFEDRLSLDLVIVLSAAELGLMGQAEQTADEYFDVVQEYLQAHYRTSHDGEFDGEVITLTLTGDQGVRSIAFDNNTFYAAIIDVTAAYERTIDYLGI